MTGRGKVEKLTCVCGCVLGAYCEEEPGKERGNKINEGVKNRNAE